jgi:hypothetical protein
MKNEYSRAIVIIMVPLGFFMLAMSWALGFFFSEHVAGLLAASATWSIPVFLASQDHISLTYRRTFLQLSSFGLVMIVFNIAYLIGEAKPHLLFLIAVAVLTLPMLAIHALLERIVFTDEERQEIKSLRSQRTRVA